MSQKKSNDCGANKTSLEKLRQELSSDEALASIPLLELSEFKSTILRVERRESKIGNLRVHVPALQKASTM